MRKIDLVLYLGMIGLLAYYLYIANQPKRMVCTGGAKEQVCVVTNYLGK